MLARSVLLALVALTVGLGVLGTASPASAASVATEDPRGDGHNAGDIRGFRASQAGPKVLLQIRTQRPLDIFNAPAWTNKASTTFLRFNIDANGGTVDHVVLLTPGPSGPSIEYQSVAHGPSAEVVCATVTQPQPTIIRVAVQTGCLDGTTVRAFARYGLDVGGNGSQNSDDRAPNFAFAPPLGLN
jgi:hypothetical protein